MKLQSLKFTILFCVCLAFFSCKEKEYSLTKVTASIISVDSTTNAVLNIQTTISPYKEKLATEMQQVFCYAPKTFTKHDGKEQSTLGNLMADLSYNMVNSLFTEKTKQQIDFAFLNYGGMRTILSKGPVTKEMAFKLMPFDNKYVVTTLSGKKIEELIQYFIKTKRAHPISKQVNLTIKDGKYTLSIHGKPFNKNKSYHVLTSDYLQKGGDSMNFFKNPEKLTSLNVKVRDVIIDYFKQTDTLKATIDNRVILK